MDLEGEVEPLMEGAAVEAMTTGLAAMPVDVDEAGGQDGLIGGKLFQTAINLAANEGGMSGDAHGSLPSRGNRCWLVDKCIRKWVKNQGCEGKKAVG